MFSSELLLVPGELSKIDERKPELLCSIDSPSLPKLRLNKPLLVLFSLKLEESWNMKKLLPVFSLNP